MKKCRLCHATKVSLAFNIPNAPGNISRMLKNDELGLVPSVNLEIYECSACGFVQLCSNLGSHFYDDYLMTSSHSPQLSGVAKEQAFTFIQRYGLIGKRVVDVGSGDGMFIKHLSQAGAISAGVEPSERSRGIAQEAGLEVYSGYVSAESPIPGGPYDAFTSREVLEHVMDPHDFLQGVRASISDGACGLIQIPSLEQAIEGGRFFDFFPDHVNYFSQRTLRLCLEMNGFVVDEVSRQMSGEYNVALVRVDSQKGKIRQMGAIAELQILSLRSFVADEVSANRRVAIWGAGGKGISLMAAAEISGIQYVIDTDVHKQGRYTPVMHFPIKAPSFVIKEPVDTIIITALAYTQEILRQLKNEMHFQGKIAVVGTPIQLIGEA